MTTIWDDNFNEDEQESEPIRYRSISESREASEAYDPEDTRAAAGMRRGDY